MRSVTFVVVLFAVGFTASLISAVVSIASATGTLPALLFERPYVLTTFTRVWGVPIEFYLSAAFGAAALSVRTASVQDAGGRAFVLATLLMASTLTLARGRPQCLAMWLLVCVTACALWLGARIDGRSIGQTTRGFLSDAATSLFRPGVVAYLLGVMLVAQWISNGVSSVGPDSATRNLTRWFNAQRPVALPELRPDASQRRRLVVFTDYQCPACGVMLPQYRSLVEARRSAGYAVELDVRDFPLDATCNESVRATLHSTACDAAAAMRLVSELAESEARAFERWLYDTRDTLTVAALLSELSRLGLESTFHTRRHDLVAAVALDAHLGYRAGVFATPTVFLDGVKLAGVSPAGLEALLDSPSRPR